jgi:chromatin remodeling complex protein RSC6
MPPVKKAPETKTSEVVKDVPPAKEPEVVEKKPVAAKGRSVKVQPEPVVVPKKEEAAAPEVATASTDDKEAVLTENPMQTLTEKLGAIASLIKETQASLKSAAREYDKLKKIVDKIQKKRENARKSPSGFAKPNKISNELCDFIGVPHGTEKSRTDITRYINSYVKEHNLNKPSNRRVILPDDKLKAILNVKDGEEVTFFILQRLISHHFPPKNSK